MQTLQLTEIEEVADRGRKLEFLSNPNNLQEARRGLALRDIRDRRLYREDFESFELYTASKWAFTPEYVAGVITLGEWADKQFPELELSVCGSRGYKPKSINKSKSDCKIYFIEASGLGVVKIGYSKNSRDRLNGLQTAFPFTLVLLLEIDGAKQEEAELHAKFKHLHRRGEWFAFAPEIQDFIASKQKEQQP